MLKKNLSALLFLSAISQFSLASSPFFIPCNDAFKNKQFQPLKEAFKDSKPESCFRLNDREFLATLTDAGRMGQGLFYYNTKMKEPESACGKNCYQPGMSVEREFVGANGKRFVLLSTSDMHDGIGSKLYEILNLVPAKGEDKPFVKYELIAAQSSTWGDRAERCGEDIEVDEDTDLVNYTIRSEGTSKVQLVFKVDGQNCKTKSKIAHEKTFSLKDGVFKAI